jgi:hypothetical protein
VRFFKCYKESGSLVYAFFFSFNYSTDYSLTLREPVYLRSEQTVKYTDSITPSIDAIFGHRSCLAVNNCPI